MAFANGMNFGLNGIFNQSAGNFTPDQRGGAINGSGIIKKKIISGLELHYMSEGNSIKKSGLTFNGGVKIMKNINTQLRITYNQITNPVLGNRTETYGSFIVCFTW
jgi:hypothetical protein